MSIHLQILERPEGIEPYSARLGRPAVHLILGSMNRWAPGQLRRPVGSINKATSLFTLQLDGFLLQRTTTTSSCSHPSETALSVGDTERLYVWSGIARRSHFIFSQVMRYQGATLRAMVPKAGLEPAKPRTSTVCLYQFGYSGELLVPPVGFEPTTYCLQGSCSTN